MDTFGPQMPALANSARWISRPALAALATGLLCLLLAGCATTIQLGQAPRTDRLGELKPGTSATSEIRRVLGEPAGRGAGRLPNFPAQDIWLYESTKTDGKETHIHMLLVFVSRDTGIYEGHIWFSADRMLERAAK